MTKSAVFLLIVLFSFSLTGCSFFGLRLEGQPPATTRTTSGASATTAPSTTAKPVTTAPATTAKPAEATPKEAFETEVEALLAKGADAVLEQSAVSLPLDKDMQKKIIERYISAFKYTVTSSEAVGDKAYLKVEITTIDIKKIMEAATPKITEYMLASIFTKPSEAERNKAIADILYEAMANGDTASTNTVDVTMYKKNNSWTANLADSAVLDRVLLGGLVEKLQDMAKTLGIVK